MVEATRKAGPVRQFNLEIRSISRIFMNAKGLYRFSQKFRAIDVVILHESGPLNHTRIAYSTGSCIAIALELFHNGERVQMQQASAVRLPGGELSPIKYHTHRV